MKISKYTFFLKKYNRFILFNSISNALIEVSPEMFSQLENVKRNITEIKDLNFDCDDIETLKKGKFITENDNDDFLICKSIIMNNRSLDNVFNITIAPTMDCNFKCYYCFEDHKKEYMNLDTINGIINFINHQEKLQHLNLTWFGGEPLMGYKIMKKIHNSIKLPEKSSYSSMLITNGFFLTKKVVDNLKELNINNIQISIDGINEAYNRIKFTKTNSNCFETLITNIDYLLKSNSNISVMIRVNLNKENQLEYQNIYNFFVNRYPNQKNLFLYPAFLKANRQELCKSSSSCFSTATDIANFTIELFKKTKKTSFIYPNNNITECAVRNPNSLAFSSDGKVYKCWETIGDNQKAIGEINPDGSILIYNKTELNRYLYGSDPFSDSKCLKCGFLPICYGGCPHHRIQNQYYKSNFDTCISFKHNIKRYIETLIEK